MLDLYRNIKYFRTSLGMTQDDLAKLTGYTDRSSIAKIERGDVDLPQSKIMLFASALRVDAGTLMGNSGIVPQRLSPDESELLCDYQKLNASGKEKARGQVKDLTKIKDYTEDTGFAASTAG